MTRAGEERRRVEAYELRERVARYDADMDIMHPNRTKMIDVALEVLPFEREKPIEALDLGVGTGYFSARLLEAYPEATVEGLDGAEAMLEVARARLGADDRVTLQRGDFTQLERLVAEQQAFDVIVSSYALHHLSREEKVAVARQAVGLLRPGGWLLNADIFAAETPALERTVQDIRVRGIVARGAGDERFVDYETTRRYLDEMEAREDDRPLTLQQDLEVFRQAGLRDVAVFWVEYREAVIAGRKAG
jgi:ubiquinone/menaquinone biosynthesis C-methylase UbiE